MEILLEIIAQCLERGDIGITIDGKAADVHAWAEGHCYQAIKKSKPFFGRMAWMMQNALTE